MNIITFENENDWLDGRKTRLLGTTVKDTIPKRGDGKKIGFYQLIADKLALDGDDENPMERGHRLESEAIDKLTEMTGITFNKSLVIITRDDNDRIAYSPDGFTDDEEIGAEVKCLKSALHIQAYIEQKIPADYVDQSIQPFVANDKLKTLYFTFYDPRVVAIPIFYIKVNRTDIENKIKEYREAEEKILNEVDQWVEKLAW